MARSRSATVSFPLAVIVDQREKLPYSFAGLRTDARQGRRPLGIAVEVAYLKTGDYSLAGYEDRLAVERKSLKDLYGTVGGHRDRFERELSRLNEMECATVIVEAELSEILTSPPPEAGLLPKCLFRSVLAWQQRFRGVHWIFAVDRDMGEATTFRVLERFYRDDIDRSKAVAA